MHNSDRNHRLLYERRDLPIFQNRMYSTVEEALASPRGDVRLVEDQRTGLIFNESFNSELMIYDTAYQNEQAVSLVFQQHLEQVAAIIIETMGTRNLIEVGCGKGFFLELLADRGVEITGFDPAYEGTNKLIRQEYFQAGTGLHSDGLILRHVLEHIPDPFSFLSQLRDANGGNGYIYIEVPCFDWICEHRAWFDVFYEHVNYFRLRDFHSMFANVASSGRIFGGQYLYVVADLASLRQPTIDQSNRANMPADFTDGLNRVWKHGSSASAVWGGASKGVIFSLLAQREGKLIDAVIDINPAKQGRFLPLTGLQVQSPEKALKELPTGSAIYVMNRNYIEEIKSMSNAAFDYVEVDYG